MAEPRPVHSSADSIQAAHTSNVPGALLDAQGAAELLNVPASWCLAEARADRIPHVRLGRYVRFDRDELVAWWRTRAHGPRVLRAGSRPAAGARDAA